MKVKSFTGAFNISLLISIIGSSVFQLVEYLILGYLDPFFIFSMTILAMFSFLLSFAINLIILKIRGNMGRT